ncbi:hypothetical protein [Fibrobacter sp. UWEL]|uniref:hypothetical protein n=1 Tax=Fibrobacter sp. UWEL TaxID=1896209 RepID=UPI00091C5422|nr:hypothetical protein [Fibrobacter sp. UWEL]SHK54608.1 hypothetical protein SAMN05720468_10369 [Fibrobacter sp. UWEL]
MIRKFIGLTLLVSVLSIIGCGNNSTDAKDECSEDPQSPACVNAEPDPVPAE